MHFTLWLYINTYTQLYNFGKTCLKNKTYYYIACYPQWHFLFFFRLMWKKRCRQQSWASLVVQIVKNLPEMQDTQVRSLGQADSPEEGHGYPLLYSCLENPMDRGAWRAAVHRVTKSRTRLKQCSMRAHTPDFCILLLILWKYPATEVDDWDGRKRS